MSESRIARTRAVGHAAGNGRRPAPSYFERQEAAGGWLMLEHVNPHVRGHVASSRAAWHCQTRPRPHMSPPAKCTWGHGEKEDLVSPPQGHPPLYSPEVGKGHLKPAHPLIP